MKPKTVFVVKVFGPSKVFRRSDVIFKEFECKLDALKWATGPAFAEFNDVALKASKIAHDFRRVGDTADGVLTFSGYDTIDATLAAPVIRSYGHSYVMDSPKVLEDIADTLIRRKPAAERKLDRQKAPPDTFWLLR